MRGARLPRIFTRLFDLPGWKTPIGWPGNWEKTGAQLARFFHWPPEAVWGLTGSEMHWWTHRANDMIDAENKVK